MRVDLTKMQVEAVVAMLRDDMDEDERLLVDTLEGETDLFEMVGKLLGQIEVDEGNVKALAEQIADRQSRKARASDRIDAYREAIQALMGCAKLDKLTLPEATLSVRQVPPKCLVTDEAAVPDELCRFRRSPDMALIKAEMESGRVVSGVTLDNGGTTLTVRRR